MEEKLKRIDKHINLNSENYLFLSEVKTELKLFNINSTYSELINLSIKCFEKLFNETSTDKEVKIKKLIETLQNYKECGLWD